MEERKREVFWQDYSATVLGMIGKVLAGDKWGLQSYVEIAYADQIVDERTPQEIIDDLKERFSK